MREVYAHLRIFASMRTLVVGQVPFSLLSEVVRMTNVKMTREGDELVIRVNMQERNGRSGSGKSEIIATTSGNQKVPGGEGASIGLNIYVK